MKDRYIIACSGMASRWNNHMGIPKKQLIQIDGETLLDRTIRLLREAADNPDIYIMALEDEYKSEFEKRDTVFFNPISEKLSAEEHKKQHSILSSIPIWNKKGDTVLIFGDVFFTNQAIESITRSTIRDIVFYGRKSRPLTKLQSEHDEIFALRFKTRIQSNIKLAYSYFSKTYTHRIIAWDLYRYWNTTQSNYNHYYNPKHKVSLEWHEVNDWTDDFDLPEDYDIFINQWEFKKNCKIRKLNAKIWEEK